LYADFIEHSADREDPIAVADAIEGPQPGNAIESVDAVCRFEAE
jgi:hypothetical protein